jgi:hypothetical protein
MARQGIALTTHGAISEAPLVQTYPLPPGIGTQAFARMAAAYDLHVLADTALTAITVEGREDDLAAFADRLAQLRRLCR